MGKFRFTYFLLGCLFLISCNQVRLSDARRQYLSGEYYTASETYRRLYAQTPRDERALRGVIAYEMAENYRNLNMAARAATAYANAIRYQYPDTLMYLRYAQMLHKSGQYPLAVKAYTSYIETDSANVSAKKGLTGALEAVRWMKQPPQYEVKRMDVFNSNRSEFSPVLAQNDEILYLTSCRDEAEGDSVSGITGLKNNDIFVAQRNIKGGWQPPRALQSTINTEFDEGVVSLTADGNRMFYTFSPQDDEKPTTTHLYVSEKNGANWRIGEPVEIFRNDTVSVFAHPAVSPSGNYLYFVSDMPGGYGGKDIWRAELAGNVLSGIRNLGPGINTAGDEMFPSILNDSTFFFSSDGHPGMGGLDIFQADIRGKSGRWQVENMKYPINSSGDDFGITFEKNGKKGFFSSNRDDARGRDHIFSFVYRDVNVLVEGFAVDKEDQFIQGAKIAVIGDDGTQYEFITGKDGTYRFPAEKGVNYVFMTGAEGFLNSKKQLHTSSLEKDTTYYVDFEMTPYNKPVILENIFYDFDKATLRPESKQGLDELITILDENPNVSIELSAHTDRKGSDEYNRQLSLRRAQSVVHYLISRGIDENRLTAAGYGKERPKTVTRNMAAQFDFLRDGDVLSEEFIRKLTPAQQEIADQINRRTEFRVTDRAFGLR